MSVWLVCVVKNKSAKPELFTLYKVSLFYYLQKGLNKVLIPDLRLKSVLFIRLQKPDVRTGLSILFL